jgi:hypothetical protein
VAELIRNYRDAKVEMDRSRGSLTEALKSVENLQQGRRRLQGERAGLLEQVTELIEAYKEAKAAQDAAAHGASKADARVQAVMAASVHERKQLVQAALRSLDHLRTHVMVTSSGMRLLQQLNEPSDESGMDFLSPKTSRWGQAESKASTMLVSLRTPDVPPLHVSAKPPSPRKRRHHAPQAAEAVDLTSPAAPQGTRQFWSPPNSRLPALGGASSTFLTHME